MRKLIKALYTAYVLEENKEVAPCAFYKSIDELPIYNYFKLHESEWNYIFKDHENPAEITQEIAEIISGFDYQFKKLPESIFSIPRLRAKIATIEADVLLGKKPRAALNAITKTGGLEDKINIIQNSNKGEKSSFNSLKLFIKLMLDIDIEHNTTTSYAFELQNTAIDIYENRKRQKD